MQARQTAINRTTDRNMSVIDECTAKIRMDFDALDVIRNLHMGYLSRHLQMDLSRVLTELFCTTYEPIFQIFLSAWNQNRNPTRKTTEIKRTASMDMPGYYSLTHCYQGYSFVSKCVRSRKLRMLIPGLSIKFKKTI